ncbi:MAG: 23S rRNA (uracil(1939)-C(5))-methyltransferase RlmD [Ruminococcaceae bacterium]|nr:23S rRNA (uracil(1939)-C(5))-methyltransferase RlmD [Oscillospiraceae bacterium]
MNKNDLITLTITSITSEGHGVSKTDGFVFFVPFALLNEKVKCKVLKVKKNIVYCKLIEVLDSSPFRKKSDCPHFTKCGSCTLDNADYKLQLEMKLLKVNDAIKRIGKIDYNVTKIIPSPEIYNYRNKALIPVSYDKEGNLVCGFFRSRTHDVINMSDCLIQDKDAFLVAKKVYEWMIEYNIPAYNEETHTGIVRHIYFRKGIHTKEIMAGIVSYKKEIPYLDKLKESLLTIEGMASIIININPFNTNVILGDEVICLYNEPYIKDKILEHTFKIGSKSFFQVNPYNVGNLYKQGIELLEINKEDIVFDIYCGIGTIGLLCAENAKEVIGVEVVDEAIEYAKENAKINNIYNATFYTGKAEDKIKELILSENKPTKVILDPPRAGCDESLINEIINLSPQKICYISCDVATLARDLKIFTESNKYKVEEIIACDMFPATSHIETVALLVRTDSVI